MRISVWSSDVCSSDLFKGIGGSNDPAMIQSFYAFDFERMVDLIDGLYGTCNRAGSADSCLADYTVDRRLNEKTLAPYLQVANKFDLFGNPAHLVAGVRYEHTSVDASAIVPIPNGPAWSAATEFYVLFRSEEHTSELQSLMRISYAVLC